jgi:ABC-type Mn2+/Zn2+ transport system permease subunit
MAALCGLLGPFVVLKRLGLLADTVAHASIFGVALGALFRIGAAWTLLPFAAALGLFLSRFSRRDSSGLANITAVAFTLFLGAGTLLLSLRGISGHELVHLLLGDILWVRAPDLYMLLAVGVFASAFLAFRYRSLMLILTNPEIASVSGVKVALWEDAFMVVLAVTIAVCTRIVGVLLASALIILPPLIAARLASSFRSQLAWSPAVGTLGSALGILLSFGCDLPFGPSIATVLSGFYLLSVVVARR